MKKKITLPSRPLAAVLLSSALFMAACGEQQSTPQIDYSQPGIPAKGDMLVSASIGEASNLIPFIASDSASQDIAGLVYNSMLNYDKNLNLTPDLAQSWQVSEDNLSITFTLRDDVRWQDGTAFTSADVSATFHTVIHPNTRTPYAGDYQLVQTFETPDAHTVRVTYGEPFAPALASWATLAILPAHKLAECPDIHDCPLSRTPVGLGPYTLQQWNPGKDVVLRANPYFYKGEPNLTHRRTRYIPDTDTQFLELQAGNLDVMGLRPLQYMRQTDDERFKATFNKYRYLGNGYTYLGFNLENPKFSDVRVRRALSHATPREQIIKGILMGQGLSIAGVFKPGTWAYNDQLQPYAYDVERAKALLAEAGWTDTNNNGTVDKDGMELSFTIVTNQGNDQRIKTAEILQQAFKQVGVEVKILVQEWATFIENTIHAKNFEAFILGWSLSAEPDPYDIWHSSKTGPREFNIIGFNNPEADALMEKARRTFDQTQRKAYLDRFQEIIHAEQPYLFLYAPYSLVAAHKRIKGIEPAPAGLGHNLEEWYVPAEQQLRNAIAP